MALSAVGQATHNPNSALVFDPGQTFGSYTKSEVATWGFKRWNSKPLPRFQGPGSGEMICGRVSHLGSTLVSTMARLNTDVAKLECSTITEYRAATGALWKLFWTFYVQGMHRDICKQILVDHCLPVFVSSSLAILVGTDEPFIQTNWCYTVMAAQLQRRWFLANFNAMLGRTLLLL